MLRIEDAKKLEAKAKAIRRKEKEFWNEVDRRKDEVFQHLTQDGITIASQSTEPYEHKVLGARPYIRSHVDGGEEVSRWQA